MFNRWVPAAKMYYVIVILTLQKQALSKIEDSCIPFQPTPALRDEGKGSPIIPKAVTELFKGLC